MGWARAALAVVLAGAVGFALVSGGSSADPRTPRGMPGMPPPFLGTAVVGGGELTAAIDAYGDVVDLRAPGPAGRALIDNPSDRQKAGAVPADTGIVPRVRIGDGPPRPLWSADSATQRYRPGTNVVVTTVRFGLAWARVAYAADGSLACLTRASKGVRLRLGATEPAAARRLRCDSRLARQTVRAAERNDRRWLRRARPLGPGAPAWAGRMHRRSLLVLRALTDRRTGAVAAGARDGWAYVWPRDAAAVALAFDAAGYRGEARRIAHFLLDLDLTAAARFDGGGKPVAGRGPQGDASGWVTVAARVAGLDPPAPLRWRGLPDYQEGSAGDFLANAIASGEPAIEHLYGAKSPARLVRQPGVADSGLDSAAAWAAEPFELPRLHPAARATMLRLARGGGRFGITPGEVWPGGDPWSAPTAWTAWSLAALARRKARPASRGGSLRNQHRARADRQVALRLLAALRRSATPADCLPERVDAHTGVPRSTTPLAWSHAFAILALQELWPPT